MKTVYLRDIVRWVDYRDTQTRIVRHVFRDERGEFWVTGPLFLPPLDAANIKRALDLLNDPADPLGAQRVRQKYPQATIWLDRASNDLTKRSGE